MGVELQAGFVISAGTVGLLSFYYDGSASEFAMIGAITLGATAISLLIGFLRMRPRVAPIASWIGGQRDSESTDRAWAAAVALPLELVRVEALVPTLIVIAPGVASAVILLDLAWTAAIPLTAAGLIAVGYGAILHYLTIEAGMRPVLVDLNRSVSAPQTHRLASLPLRVKLLAALPMINVISGLVVAALTGDSDQSLGASVLVAIGVATTISLELTLLLTRSILRPLADLRRATDAIAGGDFSAAVPVTTGDEIGELAASFNQMVSGLRERERIRKAFATYLDKEVAEYILSDSFSEEGVEREVSILFCDVRNFAAFAAEADAREVVGRLNELFEIVVPLIAAEGGHVDKFEGDGLMAVFGAPRPFADHAERAVRAALEIDRRINVEAAVDPFRLGLGINTGSVIAGSVGGGGRLNFSVIGDAVNVAARVEAETRRTGDAILLTEATRAQLGDDFETRSRGERDLKGIERPVALHAPAGASSFDEGPLKIIRDTIRAVR